MTTAATQVWREVGDGCFQRRYRELDLNVGVVRGSAGLLVIDTRSHDAEAEELLRDLRMLGGPVRLVVNTHWHYDHVFGNHRVRAQAARPDPELVEVRAGVPIIGHRRVPELLAELGEQVRAEQLERAGAGDPPDPQAARWFAQVVIDPPDRLLDGSQVLELDLGDRVVELLHLGGGHTDHDLVVLDHQAMVAFTGDLVEESGPPAMGSDCRPLDWADTLETLLARTGAGWRFVPGHGAVVDDGFVAEQGGRLRAVAGMIRELHAQGVCVDDAAHAPGWPYPGQPVADAIRVGYQELSADGD